MGGNYMRWWCRYCEFKTNDRNEVIEHEISIHRVPFDEYEIDEENTV